MTKRKMSTIDTETRITMMKAAIGTKIKKTKIIKKKKSKTVGTTIGTTMKTEISYPDTIGAGS